MIQEGRLGPYHQNGGPDLRNLQLFFTFLEEDDIVILVSDGVHDNLDPSSLHLTPQQAVEEAGLEEYKNLKFCSWAEIDPMVGSKIKEQYLGYILHEEVFKDVDLETLTPRMITKNLIEKCQRTTQPLRTLDGEESVEATTRRPFPWENGSCHSSRNRGEKMRFSQLFVIVGLHPQKVTSF